MGTDINASDWNNRIRDVVIKLAGKELKVGSAVSVLINMFWPVNKINVFDALKADLTNLVKKEILDYELNLSQSQIKGLKIVIQRYKEAKNHEKGALLGNWITQAEQLSVQFRESTNNIHLILLVINLAVLHLAGLRERLDFGKELYNEDNTEQWRKDLEKVYSTYIVDFLPKIFNQWKVWRADQIQIKAWTEKHPVPPFFRFESYASTEDTITGEKKNFYVDMTNSLEVFKKICNAHKTRMCNDASSDMAGCIATTFEFYKMLPKNSENFPKYDKDVFGRMFKGPYSEDLCCPQQSYGLGKSISIFIVNPDEDDYSPNSGPITKMLIGEWNGMGAKRRVYANREDMLRGGKRHDMDVTNMPRREWYSIAMQFVYANRRGKIAGNPQSRIRHDIDVTNKPINGFVLGFSGGVLVSVQINCYDGSSSSTYGNRMDWPIYAASPKGPPVYKLSSWSYKEYKDSSSRIVGPSVVQLEYAPQIE